MNKLKELREKSGDSQSGIADLLNVSPMTISRWEKEESLQIKPKYIEKLADHFGVSLSFLLGNEKDLEADTMVETDTEKDIPSFIEANKSAINLITGSVNKVKSTSEFLEKLVIENDEINKELLLQWLETVKVNMDNIESTYPVINNTQEKLVEFVELLDKITERVHRRKKLK